MTLAALQLIDDILDALQDATPQFITEDDLQAEIARVLREAGIPASREVRLSDGRSRIDLLADRVGIEVKIKAGSRASTGDVARQLQRYAKCDEIDALVLVTNSYTHLQLPSEIAQTPIARFHLTGALQ